MPSSRTLLAFLTVSALLWLSACGATPPAGGQPSDGDGQSTSEPNVITGVLTDQSGRPLANQQVSVVLMPSSLSVSILKAAGEPAVERANVALTDGAGRFSAPVTLEGTYGVGSVSDTTGAFTTVTVQRGADGALRQTGPVTMSAAPLGAIVGSVDGPGAGVLVFALGTSFSAITDASGNFSISRVPAGDYQVVAGVPGSISSAETVTVTAGEITTITNAIVFGPRVTGVDPQGFVTPEFDYDLGGVLITPRTITISGSGFGATQGLSILRYAGMNVDAAIDSWTDASIEVNVERLEYTFYEASLTRVGAGATADVFRFEVITSAGTSTSDPVGVFATTFELDIELDELDPSTTRVGVGAVTFWGTQIVGLTYSIEVTNGQALSSEDGSPISVITTQPVDPMEWRAYTVTFDLLRTSELPAVVTLDPTGDPLFSTTEPATVTIE